MQPGSGVGGWRVAGDLLRIGSLRSGRRADDRFVRADVGQPAIGPRRTHRLAISADLGREAVTAATAGPGRRVLLLRTPAGARQGDEAGGDGCEHEAAATGHVRHGIPRAADPGGQYVPGRSVADAGPLAAPRPRCSNTRMLAHITPLEAPIVWFAFAAGIALGAIGTYLLVQRAAKRS